jgi:hypothetical protein
MPTTLHRKFIAGVVILSISITSLAAAPARADDDTKRAIAAILGLAILGAAISESRKDRKTVAKPVPRPGKVVPPRPLPDRVSRKLLPQQCLRSFPVDRGYMSAFGQRCLHHHYAFTNRLPARCYSQIRTDWGLRGVYRAHCLRREGFQLARH